MLSIFTTIIGVIFGTILIVAVGASLIGLVYFLASTRVAEAEERLAKVRKYEASLKAKQSN